MNNFSYESPEITVVSLEPDEKIMDIVIDYSNPDAQADVGPY